MELLRVNFLVVMAAMALLVALVIPSVDAHAHVPAPAPAPSSDGVGVDQGIAYLLMAVALVLTYIIH